MSTNLSVSNRTDSPAIAATSTGPAIASALCAIVALGLGVTVIVGWHIHHVALTQIRPDYPAMQYLTAVCFVLAGGGLLAFAFRLPRGVPAALGGLTGVIGLLLSLEYLTGAKLGFDLLLPHLPAPPDTPAIRPSPPTAVCFLLCGAGIALLGLRGSGSLKRLSIWVLGSLASALCLMAICGYITGLAGTYVWGPFIGMALHTAGGLAFLSTGLLLTQRMHRRPIFEDRWLPVPVAVGTTTAALILWQALVAHQNDTMRKQSALIANNFKTDVAVQMSGPLRALERMAHRWDARGGTPYEEWRADASDYVRDEKILVAIAWVDASLRVRWVVPETGAPMAQAGADLRQETRWNAAAALDKAREDRSLVLSPTLTFPRGMSGFAGYIPLFPNGKFDGFLAGVFPLADVVDIVLRQSASLNYVVSVFEGDSLIGGPALPAAGPGPSSAETRIDFHGHEWRFVVSPTTAALSARERQLPITALFLSLVLGGALTLTVSALQQKARTTKAIRITNRELEKEITARRRIEEQLRASEGRLTAVLDSATGVSVISTDPNGLITYFSKGAERMLGYPAEEMVGKVTPAVIHDANEVAARGEELTRECGRRIEGFAVFVTIPGLRGSELREWTYVRKDGDRRTVELMVTVLRGSSGAVTGFLGTAVDITERKEMERALRDTVRERETAQALLEAAGRIARLGHWELALDGSGPKWSDVTCAIHEVPPDTPVSLQESIAFFHPDDRAAVSGHIQRSAESGEAFEYEARLITAKGREIWIHSRGEPVRDDDGRVVGFRGVFQDIDERKRAAELLERRNEQLEIARAQAEAHGRAKAEFLANMSHEIRTPLNAIIGMSELLTDSRLPENEREFIATIRTSGEVLLALINDILDFSKIESGQLDLERIPVRLRECVESALDLVAGQAAEKQLDLLYWIDPDVPPAILGDPTRLRQTLVNLLANAIKFTGSGEVFLKLTRRPDPEGGARLHVAVRDSGIGIPAERLDRLFQAFSQVDASTTRRFGGTGLGLAISHRLVELMRGRIWVESTVGKGSTFQFEIPLDPVEAPIPVTLQESGARSLVGRRLLVVDDNATNRWILQMQAESWGMVPVLANGAAQALEHIRAGEQFDVAILDVMMPDIDGYQLAARVREHRTKHDLPILILTSMGDKGRDLGKLGISGVLTKPVKIAPLFNALCKILGTTRKHARPEKAEDDSEAKLATACPLRILVAEDNPVNQRVTDLLLERLGYRAIIVANGLEVLDAVERNRFDVVLLDVQMPEMDGLEAARELCRRYPADGRPWMIALTAHALEGDRDECLAAGMDDYLSKPLRSESLQNALRHAFEMKPR
jgi:PAS domain S-box-containing protein